MNTSKMIKGAGIGAAAGAAGQFAMQPGDDGKPRFEMRVGADEGDASSGVALGPYLAAAGAGAAIGMFAMKGKGSFILGAGLGLVSFGALDLAGDSIDFLKPDKDAKPDDFNIKTIAGSAVVGGVAASLV